MYYVDRERNLTSKSFYEIITMLGLKERIKSSNTVFIKPNFAAASYARPDSHIITDIELICQLIENLLSFNNIKTIYVGDSDSAGYGYAFLKYNNLKLTDIIRSRFKELERVQLVDLSRDQLCQIKREEFIYYSSLDNQLWLSKTLVGADFIISLANMKIHAVTSFTGACKNLFGCLPITDKWILHPYIHEIIHDLVLAIPVDLSVVDAFFGMEGNGPVYGHAVDSNFRIWATSPIEADIVSCFYIGINWKKIKYLKLLSRAAKINNITYNYPLNIKKYKQPKLFLRLCNNIGLIIQKIGHAIEMFGHRIHNSSNLFELTACIFRPLLLKLFTEEQLRKIKHKVIKR